MNQLQGWIKLYRKLLDHEIWNDVSTFRLFIYLLLNASHKDGVKINGIEINRGQYLRSYSKITEDLEYVEGRGFKRYSKSTIQRCSAKLLKMQIIAFHETEHGTLFEVLNYEKYQGFEAFRETLHGTDNATKSERSPNENNNVKNINNNVDTREDHQMNIQDSDGAPATEDKISLLDNQQRVSVLEQEFVRLRGNGFFVSPKDQMSIEKVAELPVPIDKLTTWMNECFEDHKKQNAWDPIQSFKYVEKAILTKMNREKALSQGSVKPKNALEFLQDYRQRKGIG